MFLRAAFVAAALAAPTLAYEPVTCQKNATQNIVTSINPSTNSFCTMLTGYGVYPVAPNEGCASVYCYGESSKLGPPMPQGYILSTNFAVNTTYTQVTGCIDSSVWAQNPTDEGGQMDSHGWPYSCTGFAKFVSLIEPQTNTYCLRCCKENNNVDCNTSISTKGCWNVIPGVYAMADGSACKPPAGANATSTVPGLPSATVSSGTAAPTSTSGAGSGTGSGSGSGTGSGSTGNSNSGSNNAGTRSSSSLNVIGAAAALALAMVVF